MSFVNKITNVIVFSTILFNVVFVPKFLVYGDEVSSDIENKQQISNNSTIPTKDLIKIVTSQYDNEIYNKFFIRANTIIRTGESRALGAKYLNETRLSSLHDCLMWCLESPECNAAVYEEKNMQSCYLFDCGSPVNPLCKFTAHYFFSSAVLKMTQHSYELSQWGRQVQQQRNNPDHHTDETFTTPLPHITNTISTSSVPSVMNEQSSKKGICHHYQFQCVNTSECIAIYNVCDGIPQCPDESDESPELKCPGKSISKELPKNKDMILNVQSTVDNKTPVLKEEPQSPVHPSASFVSAQNVPSYNKPQEHKEVQHKDYKAVWPSSYSGSSSITKSAPQYHRHIGDADALGSPFVHKHSQFISANDPHVQNLNRWASDYDQYPSHSTSLDQNFRPYDRMDDQYLTNQMPSDYDVGKGFDGYRPDDILYWPNQDIMQDNSYTVDEFPQPGVQSVNKVISYPDKESAYDQQISRTAEQYPETKLDMQKPLNPNQPSDIDYKMQRYSHSRHQQPYLALKDSLQQQQYSSYPEMKAKGYNFMQSNSNDALYNNDDMIRASIVNQLPKKIDQIHHKQEHEIKYLNKDMLLPVSKEKNVYASTEASRDNSLPVVKPTTPHMKSIQRTVLDFKMSVAELYQSSSTHTHEANSAILALVVGVTVSFFLVVLLVCRMKTLRRRMSRKGRGLAHDADYLVNGMYL